MIGFGDGDFETAACSECGGEMETEIIRDCGAPVVRAWCDSSACKKCDSIFEWLLSIDDFREIEE